MKLGVTALIIASFVGVAVFGIIVMNHGGKHGGCLGATAQGGICPEKEGPWAFVNFHGEAFKKFSMAVFGSDLLDSLILLLLLVFILGRLHDTLLDFGVAVFGADRTGLAKLSNIPLKRELRHYLSLHENSPTFFKAPI